MTPFRRTIAAWLAHREEALRRRLDILRSERDSLFEAFAVARHDVAFERSDPANGAARDADVRKLDRASQRVRRRIRRTEHRMAGLRRRAARCHQRARALTTPHRD